MTQELAHSLLGASSSDRWMECPGSVNLSRGIPNKTNIYSEEGTEGHLVASTFLLEKRWKSCSDEMMEAVSVYTDLIQKELAEDKDAELQVEVRLDLSSIHPKMFGTADAVIYYPSRKLLRVYDYKHGAGIAVDVANNSQLKYYGLGALWNINKPAIKVELIIVQPRCFHPDGPIRRWEISTMDLAEFMADLKIYAEKTEDPKAELVPGDHCRWCPAAPICPALANRAIITAQKEFSAVKKYDPVELSEMLTKLDMLEIYGKSVRAFAYAEAEQGRCPPGFKLVEKVARRKWRGEVTEDILAKRLNILPGNLLQPTELKSPAQVEKLIEKNQKKILDEFIVAESSGTTLVSISDKRPEVKKDAVSEFTKIALEELLS